MNLEEEFNRTLPTELTHSMANNVFIIDENLKKNGIYNEDPNLEDLDENGDLKYSVDFRNIYATILSKWM